MKKIFIFIYVCVAIIFLKLIISFSINEIFIYKYNKGNYEKNLVKSLFVLNYYEPYVAHYNYGNVLFKFGYYEDAINEYNKALDYKPPKDKVCDVRINLSLSMVYGIDSNLDSEEQLNILDEAKKVLYEDNCAIENPCDGERRGGESEEAEDLENEIEEKEGEAENGENDDSGSDSSDDSEEKSEEEQKSDDLEERNKEAGKSRQEELDKMEDYDNYDYYRGKRW